MKVHQTAPQFRPWSSNRLVSAQLQRDMIASAAKDDDAVGLGRVNVLHLDEVLDLAKRSRTRELPGNYPFSIKERLIMESVKRWSALSKECFNEVEDIVANHVDRLIETHFAKYDHGGLKDTVQRVARVQIRECAAATSDKVEGLCDSENAPYTQNEHYFFDYRAKLLRRYKLIYEQSRGQHRLVTALQKHIPSIHNFSAPTPMFEPAAPRAPTPHMFGHAPRSSCEDEEDDRGRNIDTALAALAKIGINGLVAADFAKLMSDDDMTPALEIMAEVRAYFQVAYKRFGDNVPKQIDTDFVRKIDDGLDIALMSMDLSRDQCMEWLQEPAETVKKRKDLNGKKRRLGSARDKLALYYMEQDT